MKKMLEKGHVKLSGTCFLDPQTLEIKGIRRGKNG
jgi:hypothetical protein